MIVIIIPDWDGPNPFAREASLAEHYALDVAEAQMIADFKRCQLLGHEWHTCPACADRSCLRCGTAPDA